MTQDIKIKLNIGISNSSQSVADEELKVIAAIEHGVDRVSEITIHEDSIDKMQGLIKKYSSQIDFCTVPLYESVITGVPLIEVVNKHIGVGVKHFTFHLTPRDMIESVIENYGRFHINSRGGLFLVEHFKQHGGDNPHFEVFDEIIDLCSNKGISMYVGTSLRPGHIDVDGNNRFFDEIAFVRKYMHEHKSPYVLEYGGHCKAEDIQSLVAPLHGEPVCIMGPIITEGTNGYDHITAGVGQILFAQAYKNIDTLLVLTPAEHLNIPTVSDTIEGIKTQMLFRHYISLLGGNRETKELEEKFRTRSDSCNNKMNIFGPIDAMDECNMCGDYCPLRNIGARDE